MCGRRPIVRNNGSYRLEGEGITVCDQEAHVYGLAGRTVVSLCRYGQSASKPFCDGTHSTAGFQSEYQAHELPPPKLKA